MELSAMGEAWRTEGQFPSANDGLGDGDGEEDAGGADVVVVEKIVDIGFEIVGIEHPPAIGDERRRTGVLHRARHGGE